VEGDWGRSKAGSPSPGTPTSLGEGAFGCQFRAAPSTLRAFVVPLRLAVGHWGAGSGGGGGTAADTRRQGDQGDQGDQSCGDFVMHACMPMQLGGDGFSSVTSPGLEQ